MPRRFTFKKITKGDYASCFYCKAKTHFALYDKKDQSEVWCCSICALKVGKIKRLKKLLGKYPIRKKKTISNLISPLKKIKNNIGVLE